MNVLKFPTKKERTLELISRDLVDALSVVDEPMRSHAIDDIMNCADKYMPSGPISLSFGGELLSDEQRKSLKIAIQAMEEEIGHKFGGLLGEYILLRINKATDQMLYGGE